MTDVKNLEELFQAKIDAEQKIEPKDWMPEKYRKTLIRQIRLLQTQLANAPREVQLKAFLEKFPLQKDSVSGIGQSRITQLASFGIESAGKSSGGWKVPFP